MKKVSLFVSVMVMAIVLSVATAMAEGGFIEGYGETATVNQLNVGSVSTCGSACDFGKNYFMDAAQAGQIALGLKGCATCGTAIAGEINVGYDTGYSQDRDIPGGYQRQYGEQWASGTVKMFPSHR